MESIEYGNETMQVVTELLLLGSSYYHAMQERCSELIVANGLHGKASLWDLTFNVAKTEIHQINKITFFQ